MPKWKKSSYYIYKHVTDHQDCIRKVIWHPSPSRIIKKSVDATIKEIFIPMLSEGPILQDERVNLEWTYKLANY